MQKHRVQKGSLLIEILVAVSVFAVLASIGAQALVVSLSSNVAAEKKTSGAHLLSEMMGAIHAASDESWQNLYGLTKSAHYYPSISGGKWVLVAGDELVSVGNASFTRYFTVVNVSRNLSTPRDIETTYTFANDDPSTQLVSATVTSTTTDALTVSEYFFRWRNKVCSQTSWSSSGSSGVNTCSDTTYDSKSSGIDTTSVPGSIKLQ